MGYRNINRELIREGYAWAYRDYLTDRSLLKDEAHAKDQGIGLWSDPSRLGDGAREIEAPLRLHQPSRPPVAQRPTAVR